MFFRKKQILEKKPIPYEGLPENIRHRAALHNGVLHISSELKGNEEILTYFATLKKRGIMKFEFHEPQEFNDKFGRISISVTQPENEIRSIAKDILEKAYKANATDIHIKNLGSHCLVRFRIIGMLSDYTNLEAEQGRQLIYAIYNSMCQSAEPAFSYKKRQEARIVDQKFLPEGVHSVRVHTEPTECKDAPEGIGTSMFLRLLYDSTKAEGSLEERLSKLGFLDSQQNAYRFLTKRTGLVVISGPTGHGKSTVLKHCMESMAKDNPEKAYMGIEDPPEYPLKGIDQVAVSSGNEVNRGQLYMNAIAGAMRSDLDTLLIGEMRYAEAVMASINAAMTGHGVWATLHANNAFGIVLRMATLLTEAGYRNALDHICDPNVLAGLSYQRLIPILCPECKKPLSEGIKSMETGSNKNLNREFLEKIFRLFPHTDNINIQGDGCPTCNFRGVVSQKVAAEVITTDNTMLQLLRNSKFNEAHEYWIKEKQGISYIQHALQLIEKGEADPMITEMRLGVPLDFDRSDYDTRNYS